MNYKKLVVSIIICLIVGFLVFFFMGSLKSDNLYTDIKKTKLNFFNLVLRIVWFILYLMMGVSLYFLWNIENTKKNYRNIAITLFIIQLILNSLWSILFFRLMSPLLALIDIFFLWIFIALTIYYSYKVSKNAAYLLIPYFFWVSLVLYLIFSLYTF